MTDSPIADQGAAQLILHPTDFSESSRLALVHALRLAVQNRCRLDLLHVGKDIDSAWDEFPSIRELLGSWGLVPQNATKDDVVKLGMHVVKAVSRSSNVVESVEVYCLRRPVDLVVLPSAGRHGVNAWLQPSKAEKIAKQVAEHAIPTLFVPESGEGCVDAQTGNVCLHRILVPVDHEPPSTEAVSRGLRALSQFGESEAELTLLHVGEAKDFPEIELPPSHVTINRVARPGDPAAEILASATELNANAIIMVTAGTHGMWDVLRGSTTDRVLHQAPCPVLAIPAYPF